MGQLENIVDSLNLKFKTCELHKTFYSRKQARGHYISLRSGDIKEAKKDLERQMSFSDFMKKHPTAKLEKDLMIVKFKYQNYKGDDVVEFNAIIDPYEIRKEKNLYKYDRPLKNKWVFNHWKKDEYREASISAFFFQTDFESTKIPEKYARMIQYSDCMVDTSTTIFIGKKNRRSEALQKNSKVEKFMNYIADKTDQPIYNEDNKDKYYRDLNIWNSKKFEKIDNSLAKDEKFQNLLKEATEAALSDGGSSDEFEEYVGKYFSKASELKLKRSREVIGFCSQDQSPRIHAKKIALLAAETVNWETFLRAHLNIMNDNFARASDGSYAWAARQTYIRELEELEINVPDLLFGICLQTENPSQGHYYGSTARVGRALSETQNPQEIETKLLNIIRDKELDDYNRIIAFYLFLNYNNNLKDENHKKENEGLLKLALNDFPDYLAQKL